MESSSSWWIIPMAQQQGQWSESWEAELWSRTLGKSSSQLTEQKTLSNLTNTGSVCWLDHVKRRPCRGISLRATSSIRCLKRFIIAWLRLELFLSEACKMRLKSPGSNQGPLQTSLMALKPCESNCSTRASVWPCEYSYSTHAWI
jgi:hypothetical protein